MNEILVEEENTVYELDPACLRHKEEQRQLEEKRKQEKQQWLRMWMLNLMISDKRGCLLIRHPLFYCWQITSNSKQMIHILF